MTATFPRQNWRTSICQEGSTHAVRIRGGTVNLGLRPVIALHGWPAAKLWQTVLDDTVSLAVGGLAVFNTGAIDALISTGRTVYAPFTGSNWGTASTIFPTGTGGTGTTAIDDTIAMAAADGLPTTTVDIMGASHGACNALNWGWRNASKVHRMFLQSPGYDLSYLYDQDTTTIGWGLGAVSTSLRAVHGGTNKATWLPLSADYDPLRNTASVAAIADRIAIFSARDDEVVPWAALVTWCAGLGIPLTASSAAPPGGGHLIAPAYPGWDDLLPLRHLT